MVRQPISLTPAEARVLAQCSLHYYFWQQSPPVDHSPPENLIQTVQEAIQRLHAAGGPGRLSLEQCLAWVEGPDIAKVMFSHYYQRLARDWVHMLAGNETLELKISILGVPVVLSGTVDRLDKTSDGGIVAILFRSEAGPLPTAAELRQDHALAIYHALVAANYPHKRPIRLQELWLQLDQSVTIELSEEEYRQQFSRLREPIRDLARAQVKASPGLHCDVCPFKQQGCPVYSHEQNKAADFASSSPEGKISARKWIFKI
jgi:hypothetical protein